MYSLLYLTERSWEQLLLAPNIRMNVGSVVGPKANCPYRRFYALSQSLETKAATFLQIPRSLLFHVFPNVRNNRLTV